MMASSGDDVQSALEEAEKLKLEGNKYYAKNSYKQASECYTISLCIRESAAALSNRALACLKLKDPKNACIDASAALEIDPSSLKFRFRRANAFFDLKLYNQARLDLISCYQMCPSDVDVLRLSKELEIADSKEGRERAAKAIEDGEKGFYLGQVHASRAYGDYPFRLITLDFSNDDEQTIPLDSWSELGRQLQNHHRKLVEVRIENMKIDKEALVDFFHAVDSTCFAGDMVLSNVDFSVASFRNLFGKCVQPDMVQFNGVRGISGEVLSKSLNALAGLHSATTIMVLPEGNSEDAFKLNSDDVVDFLHNYGATKYRRFVTDFAYLAGGFNETVHKLFNKFNTETKKCPYELIVLCPKQDLPMCHSFNQRTKERLVAKVIPVIPNCHQMFPGHVMPALAPGQSSSSSMLIVRRGI